MLCAVLDNNMLDVMRKHHLLLGGALCFQQCDAILQLGQQRLRRLCILFGTCTVRAIELLTADMSSCTHEAMQLQQCSEQVMNPASAPWKVFIGIACRSSLLPWTLECAAQVGESACGSRRWRMGEAHA